MQEVKKTDRKPNLNGAWRLKRIPPAWNVETPEASFLHCQ